MRFRRWRILSKTTSANSVFRSFYDKTILRLTEYRLPSRIVVSRPQFCFETSSTGLKVKLRASAREEKVIGLGVLLATFVLCYTHL